MQNLPIYIVILAFIGLALRALGRRFHADRGHYRGYLLLLVPSFVLPIVGVWIGTRHMPRHEVVIHGYRVPLEGDKLYLGSDPRDDLVLHHRIKDAEQLEKSLVEVRYLGAGKEKRISQTSLDTPNIVSVDGMPLRHLPLEPGREHRITFKAFDYSDADKDVLFLEIPPITALSGDLALAHPRFTFRGQTYDQGFSHDVGWLVAPLLPNLAIESGDMRHLAWRGRIFHRALDTPRGSLLKQAALLRKGVDYFLVANDAAIRLDGRDFPSSMTTAGSARLKIESLQLGGDRYAREMKLVAASSKRGAAFFELLPNYKPHIKLPPVSVADRICFAANRSSYSRAYDILDDQFPARGMVLSREGNRFVFRGEALTPGEPYSCGKVVFSIEEVHLGHALLPVVFGLLFMLSALFLPRSLVRKVPLLGPVVATAVFLHAVRQLVAFRAWQGPPYNFNVFLDSAAAPFVFMLAVVVLLSREPFYDLMRTALVRAWNFAMPHRGKTTDPPRDGDGGKATLALLLYGLLLYGCFGNRLGANFLFTLCFFTLMSIFLGVMARWERSMSARPLLADTVARYLPMFSLLLLFALAALSAPLLGGREIVPFLPGRLRPDIVIQLVLLVIVAYQAGLWERERHGRVANLLAILGVYGAIFLLPLVQGVLARDMGFFLVVACPLITLLLMASWSLDRRIKVLFAFSVVLMVAVPIFFKVYQFSLDSIAAQRVAFWIDKPRLRAEHFFDYQAQVPILWSSAQGLFGGGFFSGDWYPALRGTCVNDNVASVFIQGELGAVGSVLVMALLGLITLAGLLFVRDNRERVGGFRIWLVLGIALTFAWTATAMFLQNLGYMPLTGKNLPFLGLDSLNDTLRYGLLLGLMVRYMREVEE